MLATEILTQDHNEARSLVEQLEDATDDNTENIEIFDKLKDALELHIREEEEIYYPALSEYKEFNDLMDENVPEHEMVLENLAQMSELSPSSETFQTLLAETKTALQAHMENEEEDVFPQSIEILGRDRIMELGERIERMKNDSGIGRSVGM